MPAINPVVKFVAISCALDAPLGSGIMSRTVPVATQQPAIVDRVRVGVHPKPRHRVQADRRQGTNQRKAQSEDDGQGQRRTDEPKVDAVPHGVAPQLRLAALVETHEALSINSKQIDQRQPRHDSVSNAACAHIEPAEKQTTSCWKSFEAHSSVLLYRPRFSLACMRTLTTSKGQLRACSTARQATGIRTKQVDRSERSLEEHLSGAGEGTGDERALRRQVAVFVLEQRLSASQRHHGRSSTAS